MNSLVDNLKEVFAVIKPDQSVEKIKVSPTIYQQLDENFNRFKSHQLVAIHEFSDDWGSWGCIPKAMRSWCCYQARPLLYSMLTASIRKLFYQNRVIMVSFLKIPGIRQR